MACPVHKSAQLFEAKAGSVWFAVCTQCDYVEMQIYAMAKDNPHQALLRKVILKTADEHQGTLPLIPFGGVKEGEGG